MIAHLRRFLFCIAILPLALLILACAGLSPGATAERAPRWACPSPEPLPWSTQGPVKREWQECTTEPDTIDPVTGAVIPGKRHCEQRREYYAEWEQEYPYAAGPPFPSPTPYALVGNSYALGQRVEVWPLHVRVTAHSGPLVDLPGMAPGSRQLQFIRLEWVNHTDHELPINYLRQVFIQEIKASQTAISSNGWRTSAEALSISDTSDLPQAIPPGASGTTLPVITPPGRVSTVAIAFRTGSDATLAERTPMPNTELRNTYDMGQTVLWSDTVPVLGNAPPCDDPGALTEWEGTAWGVGGPPVIDAPPGTKRVVALAYNQVGKRYVWGARGPETFDCQGLMVWSYAQIGISVIGGSRNQYAHLSPVALQSMQPGDMVFFDTRTAAAGYPGHPARVTHVGMVADIDRDGHWDLIHAASPKLGVRIDFNFLASAYYRPRMFTEARTVR